MAFSYQGTVDRFLGALVRWKERASSPVRRHRFGSPGRCHDARTGERFPRARPAAGNAVEFGPLRLVTFDTRGLWMSEDPVEDKMTKNFRPKVGRPPERWAEFADWYGSSPRSLKRWAAIGRENGEACPLECPGEMVGWWKRNMKHRIPKDLLKAAGVSVPVDGLEIPVNPVLPDKTVGTDEVGLEKTFERLAIMEVRLSRKADQPGQAKPWLDTISRMSTVAEKLRVEATRVGKLLPRAQVEEAIHAFHGPVEREIRLLYGTMCKAFGVSPSPENEGFWNAEVDALFGRFADVLR